jgi:hypothetical protein
MLDANQAWHIRKLQAEVVTCDGSNLKGNSAKALESLEPAIEGAWRVPARRFTGIP